MGFHEKVIYTDNSSSLIMYSSLSFLYIRLFLLTLSNTLIVISDRLWPGLLKWKHVAWDLINLFVSTIHTSLQLSFLHITAYTTIYDLQFHFLLFILILWPSLTSSWLIFHILLYILILLPSLTRYWLIFHSLIFILILLPSVTSSWWMFNSFLYF